MSNLVRLYTQNNCPYCVMMKEKLDGWGMNYQLINVSENLEAKSFLKDRGHRTVPLLYYNEKQINVLNTNKYNTRSLQEAIDKAMWPSVDSGIEQGF